MNSTKVIHLHLREPYDGKSDLYFSSVKAIYDEVPESAVGIKYRSLTNALRGKERYENKKCIASVGELHRKSNIISKSKQHNE